MAIIAGIVIDKYTEKWLLCLLAMIVGTIVCYALGTAWLAYEAKMDMMAALWAGVIPFILVTGENGTGNFDCTKNQSSGMQGKIIFHSL